MLCSLLCSGRNKNSVYDQRGLLLSNRLDLCDCLSPPCAGCHWPCPRCRSAKCGGECRQNRKWQYETVELDGVAGSIRSGEATEIFFREKTISRFPIYGIFFFIFFKCHCRKNPYLVTPLGKDIPDKT